jgi:CRP-like cAMP-binding protein
VPDDYIVRKLGAFGPLSKESEAGLLTLGQTRQRELAAGCDIIREGDDPREVYLIAEGWACRYKTLDDGRRQIMAFFLPGDLCDLHVYILREMDHSIGAVTPIRYARVSANELETLCDVHPRIVRALWWDTLVSASIQREWTVSLGQRDAYESLAHLCCELYARLRLVGLVRDGRCAFPLTHQDLADVLGLTPTHVGRVVRKLNDSRCATLKRRSLVVTDLKALQKIASFNPNYLHQDIAS